MKDPDSIRGRSMKEIKYSYRLLLNQIRKHDQKYKQIAISGEEIFIPTRWGEVRALLYRPVLTDICGPENRKYPVLFDFHGGGFVFGLPEADDRFCRKISDTLEIIVISVDYRLAPEFPYPAALEDVYDSVSYVHAHPAEFSIDPDRMAVGGHSAGANISTVLRMMAKKSGEFSFKCQILDYPAVDFKTDAGLKKTPVGGIPPPLMEMFEECYCEPEERADVYVSPLLASDEELAGLPPAIVISAGIDSLKHEDSDYATRLCEAGVPVEHDHYAEVAHGFTIAAFSPVTMSEPKILPGVSNVPALKDNAADAIGRIIHLLVKYLLEAF